MKLNQLFDTITSSMTSSVALLPATLLSVSHIFEKYSGDDLVNYMSDPPVDTMYKKTILRRDDVIEFILIQWGKNSETCVHAHPINGCLLKVFQGSLSETVYRATDGCVTEASQAVVETGGTAYQIGEFGIHKIKNNSDGMSISLHIYSPPNFVFSSVAN
jgi:predicted metal-dependent enzyme (double-stranded beta helix superfamily)